MIVCLGCLFRPQAVLTMRFARQASRESETIRQAIELINTPWSFRAASVKRERNAFVQIYSFIENRNAKQHRDSNVALSNFTLQVALAHLTLQKRKTWKKARQTQYKVELDYGGFKRLAGNHKKAPFRIGL